MFYDQGAESVQEHAAVFSALLFEVVEHHKLQNYRNEHTSKCNDQSNRLGSRILNHHSHVIYRGCIIKGLPQHRQKHAEENILAGSAEIVPLSVARNTQLSAHDNAKSDMQAETRYTH